MRHALRYLPLISGLLVAGCSSSDDGGNEPTQGIGVSIGSAVTVVQGQSGTTQVSVARIGGFAGAVNLAATNLPTGVTASFNPATIPAGTGGGNSTLTLTAAAGAPTGTGTYSVTATGGTLSATASGSVTVNAAPDFALTVAPTALSIQQGANQQANITIARSGGFTGAVNLSVANLPTGVTAAFDNAAPTGNAAVLTLTVGAAAATGTTNLTINGQGTPGTRSAQLALTVTAAPGGFTLSLNPATVNIQQGLQGQTTVTISKTGSFTGNVTLGVTGLPAGVTASFNPAQASPGAEAAQDVQTNSVLTLTVGAGVAVQNYNVQVTGTAQGQTAASTPLTLGVTAAPVSGFSIAVSPATVSVQAGANGQATVTVTKTGSFSAPVALSVTNLPAGITAAFNPASASAGKTADTQTPSTLTLTVGAAVTPQDYNLNIRGASEGQPNSDKPLTLTVTAAPGGFTLSVNPTTVSVLAGQSGNATVTINKTGSFTGDVTLSAVGLPANVTATFNPPAASPQRSASARSRSAQDVQTQSTMTLAVGGSVATNNYPFQIRGTAQGQGEQLINATLAVTAPGPGNSTIRFCDLDNLPIWFAFKNGNGGWVQVTGTVNGDGSVSYVFDITQSTGAYAFVTGSGGTGYRTSVFYGTQGQLSGNGSACLAPNATRTLNGSIAGINPTDQVLIQMGGGGASANAAQPNFQLTNVLNGPSDLWAVRSTFTIGPPISTTPIGIILRRALNIPDLGTIPVLDFSTAEAFAPITAQFTLNNLGTDTPVLSLAYQTPTTTGSLYTALGSTATQTVYGIPGAKQEANDLHMASAIAGAANGDARGHFEWFKTLADKTFNLGPALTMPTVTSLGTAPYPRYQSTGPIQAEYDDGWSFIMTQTAGGAAAYRSWIITVGKGFFGGATYTMAMEDMSAAGYLAAWGLQVGTQANHQTQAVAYSTNGIGLPFIEGGTSDFASRAGQVTP